MKFSEGKGYKKFKNWGKTTFFKGNVKKCAIFRKTGSKNEVFGEKRVKKMEVFL